MKFCPVVPEIRRGQVHGPWKERRKRRKRRIIILTRYDYNLKPGIHDTSFASKSPFKKTWIKKT